jgi:RNA polymerase sigma-70 factor (ECF subfamily)
MDPQRLGLLIDQHAPALALYARQWCCSADDVVQEAFLQLASRRQPPENVVAWLYRVVRNAAVSSARAERRRRRHEKDAASLARPWFLPREGADLDGLTARDALQALPLELREPLVAHLWGGLSFEQIGALLGVSGSTAHRRYLEALSALRERLRVSCSDLPTTRRPGRS